LISNNKLYLINLSHQQKYSVCQLIKKRKTRRKVTTRKANHSKIQCPTVIKQFAQMVAKAKLK
jgi:hypothetical protein